MDNEFYIKQSILNFTWIYFGEWRGYWFKPSGIESLAGFLKYNDIKNIQHNIWYYKKDDIDSLLSYLEKNDSNYIGFSVYIGYIEQAIDVYKKIETLYYQKSKAKPFFIFGNNAFLDKDSVLQMLKIAPDSFIVVGEGEDSLLKLITEPDLKKIPNLFYTDRITNEIVYTYAEKLQTEKHAPSIQIENIINVGFNPDFANIAYIEESRGCGKKSACTFCSNSMKNNDRKWRQLNQDTFVSNLLSCAQMNPIAINFTSEDFGGGNIEIIYTYIRLIKEIREKNQLLLNTNFYASMRVPSIYCNSETKEKNQQKEELLSEMQKVGFTTLFFGFESGSNSRLRRMNKLATVEENERVVELCRKYGIHIDGGIIMFDDMGTLKEYKDDIKFFRKIAVPKLMITPFHRLEIYPNTGYHRIYERKKDTICHESKLLMNIIINKVEPYIDIKLLERFLQKLRLLYFENTKINEIQILEVLALEHGNFCFDFLEQLIQLIEKDDKININECVDNFTNDYKLYLLKIRNYLVPDRKPLFFENLRTPSRSTPACR